MQLEQPIKQKFLDHRKAHQDMLLKEEQAKASMEVKARMAAMPQPQPMLPPPAGGPA